MLDIENKFKEDGYKEKLLEDLQQELQKVKRMVNSGLAPDDYNRFSKYSTALDCSILVLNQYEAT
jgi:hypothetical protein